MKVGFVKYSRGAGHIEDYIGLYGLIDVESSLYLVNKYEFFDDIGLVASDNDYSEMIIKVEDFLRVTVPILIFILVGIMWYRGRKSRK